jgi:sugar O-acyltransferase (sialic acid O-acetyltransferase NeuD family)
VGLLVVGAGGHAKVVIDAARAAGLEIAGVVGEPRGRTDLLGVPIVKSAVGLDADTFIIAVGDNRARAQLFAEYLAAGLHPAVVVHPSAVIADGVEIGGGTLVAAGVVVNVDARVGENAILNTSCTIDHDCLVGDHAHIGPTSGLCGGVAIGTGALVGVGCSITPTRSVGEWAVVGAGSVVVRDLPATGVYAGVPARPIRPIEE